MVFNVLTGNGDAHLKNLSFLVSEEGIQLAPHYDLLSTSVYGSRSFDKQEWPQQSALAWPILQARNFGQVDREGILDAAEAMSLRRPTAQRLLDAQCHRIMAAAAEVYREFEDEAARLRVEQPELGATLAGEGRCLRAIIHVVVSGMVKQLVGPSPTAASAVDRGTASAVRVRRRSD